MTRMPRRTCSRGRKGRSRRFVGATDGPGPLWSLRALRCEMASGCRRSPRLHRLEAQIECLGSALAEREARGLRLDPLEHFGVEPFTLRDVLERDRVVGARRQVLQLELAVLRRPRGVDVPAL